LCAIYNTDAIFYGDHSAQPALMGPLVFRLCLVALSEVQTSDQWNEYQFSTPTTDPTARLIV